MPDTQVCAGRLEKDVIQKSNMHVDGKSDGRAVPTKCPNKSGNSLAEGTEGRRPAMENTEQPTASQTQSWGDALSGLRGAREAAKRDKRLRFTALLHPCIRSAAGEQFLRLEARRSSLELTESRGRNTRRA
jgi:RNA-directed DNA polymerase